MKKRYLFTITAIAVAAIMITACGSTSPKGSSAQMPVQGSSVQSADKKTAETDLIEVDVKKLPEGITENDLMKDGDSYYLDQTEFKYLAKAAGKDLSVESTDGYEYTANAKGNMVTRVAVTEKKEDTEKKADQKQNGTTASSGTTGTNQTVAGGTTNSGTASSGSAYSGNSGSTSSGNTSGGSSSGNSGSTSGGGYVAPTQPAQPVHEHIWQAVYRTETTDQGWYENIYEDHAICNGCGAIIDGNLDHIFDCGPGSYRVTSVVVGQRWVSNPVTTQILDHYVCLTCGATK